MNLLRNLKLVCFACLSLYSIAFLISCGNDEEPSALKPPSAPELASPANSAQNVTTLATFNWQASESSSNIRDYTVFLDTNADPTTIIATGSATSLSLTTPLNFSTTYYWKVQVTDEKDLTATSDIYSFTTISENTQIEINDEEFGKALVEQGYAFLENEKYILDLDAAATVTNLNLGGSSSAPLNIRDIDGIQFFTSLRALDCDYTSITNLDLSNNTNLDTLQYTNSTDNTSNFLSVLSLPSNVKRVRVFRHNLSDFDASSFPELEYLRLDGNDIPNEPVGGVANVLETLILSETVNTKLVHLDMGGNLDNEGNAITYEVSQALYNQLIDPGVNNKEGVVLPPTFSILSIVPVDGTKDITLNANIEITFSSEVNESTISYTLTDDNNTVIASTITAEGLVATINPDANLSNNTSYTVAITEVTGTNGANIDETFMSSFTTISGDDIVVSSVKPTNTAANVEIGTDIQISFSDEIDLSTVTYTLTQNANSVASTPSSNGSLLIITPDNSLAVSTAYTLTITATEGLSGGTLVENFTSTFTTVSALQLQGVMSLQNDGTAADGRNRAIHLRANVDIADLGIYGIGIPNNGGGTDGKELSLPSMSINSGQNILFMRAEDEASFATYFGDCFSGFEVTFTDADAGGDINFNGDDAVELYENTTVIEIYGDVELDGTGENWEYNGSWGYRESDGSYITGAIDCTLNATDNASASCPYPFCSE